MDNIRYRLYYAFWYLLSLLPLRVLYGLADVAYVVVAYLVRYRRRTVRSNLQRCFPEKSEQERRQIERRFYRYFCDYVVETAKMMTMSERQIRRRMVFTNIEPLCQALSEGQSVGLYLGHVGNWEWLSAIGYWLPQGVVNAHLYHPLEDKMMDRLFLRLRSRHSSVGIPMKETMRRLVAFRQQGKTCLIGYISDQGPKWQNIHHWLTFLGQETPVFTGAERIVKSTNQVFAYGEVTRRRRGYYQCHIHVVTREPQTMPDWQLTDTYFRLLERTIRRTPHLWLWSHKRWKRTREEFNRRFEVINGKVRKKENKPETI
ncbi:MAG: lysophospholipid acyltransferase family protein [Bacteroidaceae bacterium]|nr:lysophospholipid acyltransferase family protein [Bacteroidaceae bacterium]